MFRRATPTFGLARRLPVTDSINEEEELIMSWIRSTVRPLGPMLGLVLLATMPAMGADLANGKKVYTDRCARCHGVSGRGDGPRAEALDKKPRDYADAGEMEKVTDADLRKIVLQGKGAMPSYKGRVSDKDLEGVIAYIRTFAKR